MAFLGSMFDPNKGAGFQAQGTNLVAGTTPEQLAQAYQQAQGGINQQQAFANAVAAQGGLGNQSGVFAQQQALANQLGQQAQGLGANPAAAQLAQSTGENAAMQAALMGSQRGAGANVGLLGRQAAQRGGALQQQSAGQAAIMRANQQLAAQQALQQQQQMMAGLSTNQAGMQQNALAQLAQQQMQQQQMQQQAAQAQNAANVQMQSNINQTNAGIAAGNQKTESGLFGGLLGAAGTALAGPLGGLLGKGVGSALGGLGKSVTGAAHGGMIDYRQGGKVPGKALHSGDHESNDTIPAVLSPGEIVLPRSVSQAPNAADRAREFVEDIKQRAQHFAEGGESQPKQFEQDQAALRDQNPAAQPNITVVNNPAPGQQMQAPLDVNQGTLVAGPAMAQPQGIPKLSNPKLAQTVGQATEVGTPTGGSMAAPAAQPDLIGSLRQSYGQQQKATGLLAEAQGAQGQAEAAVKEAEAEKLKDIVTKHENSMNEIRSNTNKAVEALKNGEIKPNHIFENMSTAGKVSTAIGLIMGGMGAGITGGPNPAMDFLNKQIERDIDAQKANMDKQRNLVSIGMQMFNNEAQAIQWATAAQKAFYASKFEQAGAASKSPIAKAIAMDKSAQLNREAEMTIRPLAMQQQMLSETATGAVVGRTPEESQDAAFRHAALRVQASPVLSEHQKEKALDELDKQLNLNRMQTHVVKNFDDISKLQTLNLSPVQYEKQIDAMWNPMLDRLTTQFAGQFSETAMKNIEHLKPKMTDSPNTLALKRQQFIDIFHQNRASSRLGLLGINIPESPGTHPVATNVMRGYQQAGIR